MCAWSVTVTDPQSYEENFPADIIEQFSSQNPAYARDADLALMLAKLVGVKSVTLAGGRTPVIGETDDEIVFITITGSVKSSDFRNLVKQQIMLGPGSETVVARHYQALTYLYEHPCNHYFHHFDGEAQCSRCFVVEKGGFLEFPDGTIDPERR